MKYLWTSLFIKDLEKSIKFYEEVVGLKVERRFQGGPGTEIAFMQSEDAGTKVELICNGHAPETKDGAGVSLGFLTSDIDKKLAEMKAAGYDPTDIISPHPGTKFFFIKDPDGLSVQFVEE
jgi:lactoylglutathione lyase